MGSGGSSGRQTTTQTTEPWVGQRPHLKRLYDRAEGAYQRPLEYFPESTVSERDPATREALARMEARGRQGSPLTGAAQGYAQDVVGGEYLNANPHLDQAFNTAAENVRRQFETAVLPGVESRFAGAGRLGSGARMGALSDVSERFAGELSGLAADIYGGAYERERDRQTRAAEIAPSLAREDYYDLEQLQRAGLSRELYSQRQLDDLVARHEYEQLEPWQRLELYGGSIGAPVPGGGTTTAKQQRGSVDWARFFLGTLSPQGAQFA